ncbi:MAG: hypothetical protein JW784_02885 [Candidatus Cloacimonetes bacterium]|nr:hypothetical protein [Candidatus Cloacimonadota bacterium]
MKTTFIVLLFIYLSISVLAGLDLDEYEMAVYYMGFLWRNLEFEPAEGMDLEAIGQGHLENIEMLANAGKLLIAGPFARTGDPENDRLAGIFIFSVETLEEAEELIAADPAVVAGIFTAEVRTWYGPQGLTYTGYQAPE